MIGTKGLVGVRDEHLVALFRAVHRGDVTCPLNHRNLAAAGFLGIADHLEHLQGARIATAVVAVITAVLAERSRGRPPVGVREGA